MPAYLKPDLYVTIQQLENGPKPFPLDNGFNVFGRYEVIGIVDYCGSDDAWFILPNDRKEIWFISNRHLRYCIGETINGSP